MRTLFPIVLNVVFGLYILGIIIVPLELRLPTRMLMSFYIVSILLAVLAFGLIYTIIDIRNILLEINKNINKIGNISENLSENVTEGSENIITDNPKEISKTESTVKKINAGEKSEANENKLICPFCGADYSEYPYATACFNCHKFFDSDKNQPQK